MFVVMCVLLFFFFKQKTAYEMRISDWSSDVCSSDLFFAAISARFTQHLDCGRDIAQAEIETLRRDRMQRLRGVADEQHTRRAQLAAHHTCQRMRLPASQFLEFAEPLAERGLGLRDEHLATTKYWSVHTS